MVTINQRMTQRIGLKNQLPNASQALEGEIFITTDSKEMYFASGGSMNQVANKNELTSFNNNLISLGNTVTTHLDEEASLTKKGHTQLSSSVTSTSESLSATPKAVKTVYDELKDITKYDYMMLNETVTIDRSVDNVIRFGRKIYSTATETNFVAQNGDIHITENGLYEVTFELASLDLNTHTIALRNGNGTQLRAFDYKNARTPVTFFIRGTGSLVLYHFIILADSSANPQTSTIYADATTSWLAVRKVA